MELAETLKTNATSNTQLKDAAADRSIFKALSVLLFL